MNKTRTINLLDFEEILKGINPLYYIDVKVRSQEPHGSSSKYYAQFNNLHIKDEDGGSRGHFANGSNSEDAIMNLCDEISGKTLTASSYKGEKDFEVKVPQLYYEL